MARLVFDRDRRALPADARAGAHDAVALRAGRRRRTGSSSPTCTAGPRSSIGPPACPDLRFNISHTDGLIACAVTIGREVGVDVEHVGRRLTHDVAGRFFAPREVADLRALPDDEQQRVFFDYWTLKEAYIKARGFGLALPLGDFAFKLNPPDAPAITFEPALEDDPAHVAVPAGLADAAASPWPRGAA